MPQMSGQIQEPAKQMHLPSLESELRAVDEASTAESEDTKDCDYEDEITSAEAHCEEDLQTDLQTDDAPSRASRDSDARSLQSVCEEAIDADTGSFIPVTPRPVESTDAGVTGALKDLYPLVLDVPRDIPIRQLSQHPSSRSWHAWSAFFSASHSSTRKADEAEDDSQRRRKLPYEGIQIAKLRQQFSAMQDGSGLLSLSELLFHSHESLERRAGPLSRDCSELLAETCRRKFEEICLGLHDNCIGAGEWIHFMMMRITSPSHIATKHLNKQLQAALLKKPHLLTNLHQAYERMERSIESTFSKTAWEGAFKEVGSCQPLEEDMHAYGFFTYFEFVSHALGAKLETVQLAMYDTSEGTAKWIPSMLLGGRKFEGIWHTGVRVFGKEFWYGGGAYCQAPEDVPFGRPARIVNLGKTLRSVDELKEFLHLDLLYIFNRASYDVLHHNCNDFSNEIVQFLLHGQQIPEEVRMQPKWAENATLAQAFKPVWQQRLGSFGDSGSTLWRQSDDVTDEWRRRLQEGDMVLFRSGFTERPIVVQLDSDPQSDKTETDHADWKKTTDIRFFVPCASTKCRDSTWAEWQLDEKAKVPLSHLYPFFPGLHQTVMHLQLGWQMENSVRAVLRRQVMPLPQPSCPRGHLLQEQSRSMMAMLSQAPRCSICHEHLHEIHMQAQGSKWQGCTACEFQVCPKCLEVGVSLHGGGIFADLMSPSLARDMLSKNNGWRQFKAAFYFNKAEINRKGGVDLREMHKLVNRLRVELGLPTQLSSEFANALDLTMLHCQRKHEEDGKFDLDSSDLEIFEMLFHDTITEAVAAGSSVFPFHPEACKVEGLRKVIAKKGCDFVVAL